ncbi:MAG: prolyl oligopeptidase family serine peptidase [Gammaproteobacteria bacterium]|nr:prolyl oligopeptidase family serine peptidase [Gammaproteobacteria bacterium]
MDYDIPEWDMDAVKEIQRSSYGKHSLVRYELPDARPVLGQSTPIIIDVYFRKPGRPALIAHPVVGSKHNEVAELFAKTYCHLGWNAVIVHRAQHPMEGRTPEEFEQLLRNIIYNDIQVEQYLTHKGLIQSERCISFGASLGGVSNALLTSVLPYKGFVCMVAGGPIAEVMARMDNPEVDEWRQARIRELGYSGVDEFEQRYLDVIETDSLRLANRRANVLMFNAMFDRIVRPKTQRKLSRAFGWRNPSFWFPAGHATIVLFLPVIIPLMWVWSLYTLHIKR